MVCCVVLAGRCGQSELRGGVCVGLRRETRPRESVPPAQTSLSLSEYLGVPLSSTSCASAASNTLPSSVGSMTCVGNGRGSRTRKCRVAVLVLLWWRLLVTCVKAN